VKAVKAWGLPVALLLVVSFIVYALALSVFPLPPLVRDAYGYTMTSLRVLHDHVFSFGLQPPGSRVVPNDDVTPGYPLLLSAIYLVSRVSPANPVAAITHVEPWIVFLQLLMGVGIVLMLYLCGRSLGGHRLGLVAGIAATLYLPFAWASSTTLADQAGTVLFAIELWLALELCKPARRRTLPMAFCFGLLVATTDMMRPALALWPFVPITYMLVRRLEPFRRVVLLLACGALGFALVFAPWWVRSAAIAGRFVPIRTNVDIAKPVDFPGGPVRLTSTPPIPDYPVVLRPWTIEQATPARTHAGETAISVANPWVPQLADVWEDVYEPGIERIGFAQPSTYNPYALATLVALMTIYQRVLVGAAIIGMALVVRSRRLLLAATVPLYVIAIHYNIQLTIRYFYPAMPAVVLLASCAAFVGATLLGRQFSRWGRWLAAE